MKRLVLISTLVILLFNVASASHQTTILSVSFSNTDTIKGALTTHCRQSVVCNQTECIHYLVDSIKQYPASSYLLIYKIAGSGYVMEKKPDINKLLNYKISKIMILEDHIRIGDVEYYDKKRAVIIE